MSQRNLEADIYLWKKVVESDEQAFASLYNKYSSSLFSAAFKLLKDSDACEDIIQEVFVHIWLKRYDIQVNDIKSYLYQSVKYKVIDLVRRKKVSIPLSEIEDIIATERTDSHVLKQEIETVIDRSVEDLPQRCAEIFKLKKEHYLSNKEIAQKLNISTKTVENQITIAIKRIKISLSDKMGMTILLCLHLFNKFF